jgi:hypothetical protein
VTVRALGRTVKQMFSKLKTHPLSNRMKGFSLFSWKESPFEVAGVFQGKFQQSDDGMAIGPDERVSFDIKIKDMSS